MRLRTSSARARSSIGGLFAVVAVLAATLFAAAPAAADHDVTPARVAGDDRFATAAEIAAYDHPEGSGVALLANGRGFADALAASPLARPTAAPLLLTERDVLPDATDEAFQALGVQHVVLLGGTAAISAELEAQLEDRFDRVTRFGGNTRFDTAAAIAESIDASPNADIGAIDGERTAMIVNAFAAADAVVAGAFAAGQANPFPILFTEQGVLTHTTEQALQDRGIEHVIIVGGELAVGTAVERRLADLGMEPTRLGGADRLATATRVADHGRLVHAWDLDLVNLARGDDFADALAAGPYAGRAGAPILLAESPGRLGANTAAWLAERCPDVGAVRAIGGVAAVSEVVLDQAVMEAERCHQTPTVEQTYIVAPQEAVEVSGGQYVQLTVGARYDGLPFNGPVDVAIFPCGDADVLGSGDDTFDDIDSDGVADSIGESDTGDAAIVDINGESVDAVGHVEDVGPGADGTLAIGLNAQPFDCAVPVVFADMSGDGQLNVDAEGRPAEPYGVGHVTWS